MSDPHAKRGTLDSAPDVSRPWHAAAEWLDQHRRATAAVALLGLAGVGALAWRTSWLGGAAGSWAPWLVAASALLLLLNWALQWRPDAPARGWGNRTVRVLSGLGWLALTGACTVVYARAASLPAGVPGVARFELVGDWAGARALGAEAESWTADGVGRALRVSVTADWWFILSYVVLLVGMALWLGHYYRMQLVRDARYAAAALAVGAGILDCLENLFLWRGSWQLSDPTTGSDGAWTAAACFAWPKFVLALGAVLYVAGALMSLLWSRQWTRARGAMPFWEALSQPPNPAPKDVAGTMLAEESGDGDRKLGIALSGGGIRASSISLGALQTLESEAAGIPEPQLGWGQADEVTAISGGSNMAGGWSISRTARRHGQRDPEGRPADAGPEVTPGTPDAWRIGATFEDSASPEELHLFENLGYLVASSPRGDARDVAATEWGTSGPRPGSEKPPSYRPPAYATVVAGFLLNVVVFLTILWLVVRPLGWLYRLLAGLQGCRGGGPHDRLGCLTGQTALVVPGVAAIGLGLVVLVVWVAADRIWAKTVPGDTAQKAVLGILKGVAQGALVAGAVLIAVLVVFPYLMDLAAVFRSARRASLVTLVGWVGTVTPVVRLLRKPSARMAPALGGVVFVLLVAFLASFWAYGAYATRDVGMSVTWWLVIGAAVLVGYTGADPGWWSLAPFYRGKLRLAYATRRTAAGVASYRNDSDTDSDASKEPALHTFLSRRGEGAEGTPLTICTTCTVSSRAVKTHYGIPALSVTFDPQAVRMFIPQDEKGTWAEYSCATWAMDSLSRRFGQGRLTTMLAVAISSAAVSPAMGRFRIGPTSMLLTFANVRLGVWMPNPRYVAALQGDCARRAEVEVDDSGVTDDVLAARRLERTQQLFEEQSYPRVRFGYLFKEFLGIHDTTDPYLYLTDGGHWENTGLVELLRRGNFREVVCVDADPGPGDAVRSLSQAIDLAALECDALVNINLDPLRATGTGSGGPEYSTRSVTLGFFELHGSGVGRSRIDSTRIGVLWYSKPALTPDMPASLLAHRETHPDYPRISTFDQFFDASTFIAYRDLGRYNAQVIRRARFELLRAMAWSERRFGLVEPTYREFRRLDTDQPQQVEAFLAGQDRYTARLLEAFAHDPGLDLTEFEVFASRVDAHWACEEVVSLVRRRLVDPQERDALYQAIKSALRDGAGPPAARLADQQVDGFDLIPDGPPEFKAGADEPLTQRILGPTGPQPVGPVQPPVV